MSDRDMNDRDTSTVEVAREKRRRFMSRLQGNRVFRSVVRHGLPDTNRNRALTTFTNFFLHVHPTKVRLRAMEFTRTFYLGGLIADTNIEAVEWLDRALELDPAHDLALIERSQRYAILRDLPAALADAERLITARPRSVKGHRQKSRVARWLHDEELALAAIERAIELDPEHARSYYERALLRMDRGGADEAAGAQGRHDERGRERRRAGRGAHGAASSIVRDGQRCSCRHGIPPDSKWNEDWRKCSNSISQVSRCF